MVKLIITFGKWNLPMFGSGSQFVLWYCRVLRDCTHLSCTNYVFTVHLYTCNQKECGLDYSKPHVSIKTNTALSQNITCITPLLFAHFS